MFFPLFNQPRMNLTFSVDLDRLQPGQRMALAVLLGLAQAVAPATSEELEDAAPAPEGTEEVAPAAPRKRGRPRKTPLELAPVGAAPVQTPMAVVSPAALAAGPLPAELPPPPTPNTQPAVPPPQSVVIAKEQYLRECVAKAYTRLGATPACNAAILAAVGKFRTVDGTPCTKLAQVRAEDVDALADALNALKP